MLKSVPELTAYMKGLLDALVTSAQSPASNAPAADVDSAERTAANMKVHLTRAEKLAARIAALSAENERGLQATLQREMDKGFAMSFADLLPR